MRGDGAGDHRDPVGPCHPITHTKKNKKTKSAAAAKQNPKTGWALEQEEDPLS